jgi:L,D-transpeptidase YcbB
MGVVRLALRIAGLGLSVVFGGIGVAFAEPDLGRAEQRNEFQNIEIVLPDLPFVAVDLPQPDPVSTAIARRLRLNEGFHVRLGARERASLTEFYEKRAYEPVFLKKAQWSAAAQAVIAMLKNASEEGLSVHDYPIPALGVTRDENAADLAQADIALAASTVLYARDARGGRIDLTRLSRLVTPKLSLPSAEDVLTSIVASPDAGRALLEFQPPHADYKKLRAKLHEYRALKPRREASPLQAVIPQGPTIKLGMKDPRVPLIRARFGLGPSEPSLQDMYDEPVASAVADFQKQRGIVASGNLNSRTVTALGAPLERGGVEAALISNMERWRWLPSQLGARHIFVNVPEFRLKLEDQGRIIHETRVIVGTPETPTPLFSDQMEHLILNPSWHVPPSILKKEFLPKLAADPEYAVRKGFEVVRRGDSISIRQPPGERNALGFIKFIFPNDHAVYLHDTPNRSLFGSERRAFSHGCVRVDQPFRLAEVVLGGQGSWSEGRLRSLIGKGERTIMLKSPLPVHLAYFTLIVDESGQMRSFEDIYGVDQRVRRALGLSL